MNTTGEGTFERSGGAGVRHRRGDGSALASFLCPICFRDVLTEDVACDHLLMVRDRFGEIYCRDLRIRRKFHDAEDEAGDRGERAVELLCERLGPTVVLYELVDAFQGPGRSSVLFVVDVGQALRGASAG